MGSELADLFRSYWWLLFPIFFFVFGAWNNFMRYKRTQAKVEILKAYAQSGKEPPAELIASLDKDPENMENWAGDDDMGMGKHSGGGGAFLVFLFAGLAGVFAFTGYSGWLGDVREEFYFIALILGVLSVAFLANSLFGGGKGK